MSLLDQTIHPIPDCVRVVFGNAGLSKLEHEAYEHMRVLIDTGIGPWNASKVAADVFGMTEHGMRSIYYRRKRAREKALAAEVA